MSIVSLITIHINSLEVFIKPILSVLEACKYLGFYIPRFCYHETLSIAGNCRMCLVEIKNSPKPVAACFLPLMNNMKIYLDTPLVLKARENVLEALLLNHPLDCPICDQGGECDLQDQVTKFGTEYSRYFFKKRGVEDKYFNPIIKTIMTRCIHCTRCIRFSNEILGHEILGVLNRGGALEIGNYIPKLLLSELTGNIIDLCPVGALTSKHQSFKTRPWELQTSESIDILDSLGSHIYINYKDLKINRILPKINFELNNNLISDNARYFFDSLNSQRLFKFYSLKTRQLIPQTLLAKSIQEEIFLTCQKDKSLFIIDDQLDLISINLLKFLSYKYDLKVRILKKPILNNNFFVSNFSNKVSNLNSVKTSFFIISSNLKLENSIINSKLRIKFLKEDIQIYHLLGNAILNYFSLCINLNINYFLQILEGKKKITKFFIFLLNPCFIIGENICKRGLNYIQIKTLLKFFLPSSFFLNIREKCNSEGITFSAIKLLTKKDLTSLSTVFMINLKETLQIYKCSKINKRNIFWLNTHGASYITNIISTLVPLLPFVHENYIYLNLEQRPQTTTQLFPIESNGVTKFSLEIKNFLQSLLFTNIKLKYLNFYTNIIENFNLFNFIPRFNSILILKHLDSKEIITMYPVKFYIEDYYISNKLTQFSELLSKCSYEIRHEFTNFIKN
jgi:NADH-quinone oxidoreductase chain G